jgi:pilus assembly protein Flp/PilA
VYNPLLRLSLIRRIARDERGATAVEYGLILALITLASMSALLQMAGGVVDTWNHVATAVTNVS